MDQYPSLPLYVAAGGLALGVISASGQGGDQLSVQHLGGSQVARTTLGDDGYLTMCAVAAIGFQRAGVGALPRTMIGLLVGRIRVIASSYINVDTQPAYVRRVGVIQRSVTRPRNKICAVGAS